MTTTSRPRKGRRQGWANPSKRKLTRLQLALLGKGPVQALRTVSCAPWRGTGEQ